MTNASVWLFGLLTALIASGQAAELTTAPVVRPECLSLGDPTRRERRLTPTLDGITDTESGQILSSSEWAERMRSVQVLFIGEEHTNDEFHRVQWQAIRALHAAGRRVHIGLEMFPWGPSKALDRWVAGELDEQRFLDESRWYEVWSHQWGHYRQIFHFAREQQLAMYGLNAPREAVREVRRTRGFEQLDSAVRTGFAPRIDSASTEHRQLVQAYFAAEDTLHRLADPAQQEGIYLAQLAWDAAMGWQAARLAERFAGPQDILVVLIGAGHVAYDLGAARQLAGNSTVKTSSLIPTPVNGICAKGSSKISAAYAQYLWGVANTPQPSLPVSGISLMGRIGREPTQVIHVEDGSPAAMAGVRVGDILRTLDRQPLANGASLQRKLGEYQWGDAAVLGLERDGTLISLTMNFRRAN